MQARQAQKQGPRNLLPPGLFAPLPPPKTLGASRDHLVSPGSTFLGAWNGPAKSYFRNNKKWKTLAPIMSRRFLEPP